MSDVIYVITAIEFGFKYANPKRSDDGKYHSYFARTSEDQKEYFTIRNKRTWGWYSDLKTAKESVEMNNADIYEGQYNHAVIEEVAEGILFGGDIPKEWWYKWEGTWEEGGYKPAEKPGEYLGVMGFMN